MLRRGIARRRRHRAASRRDAARPGPERGPVAWRSAAVIVAIVALAAGGCYTYSPSPESDVRVGEDVRAQLTGNGADAVARVYGRRLLTLDGLVVGADADSVVLAVWRADRQARLAFEPRQDTIPLARTHIDVLERRELAHGRTALLAGGIGALLYVAIDAALQGGEDEGSPGDDGDTQFLLVPIRMTAPW